MNSSNMTDVDLESSNSTIVLDCPKFDDAAMKMVEGFSFW